MSHDTEIARLQMASAGLVEQIITLAEENAVLRADAGRLDWLERWIADNSWGREIYPIGPDYEYGPDGNTVVRVLSWSLADKEWPVETLRAAIDAAMEQSHE